MLISRRGFSLIELLVAMVLLGVVSTGIYRLLTSNQRLYRQQTERVDLNQNLRAALAVIPSELRELDAADAAGSDIVSMSSSAIAYNAGRNTYLLCQAPNAGAFQVTVNQSTWIGTRPLDITLDRFMIFAENDPNRKSDNVWLRAGVTGSTVGTACPGGAASITLTLTGVTAAQLAGVTDGAPIRGYEVLELALYADAAGNRWLGSRAQNKTTLTWSAIQPITGPLTASGLQFAYFDANGVVTAVPAQVARVGVTVSGTSVDKVRTASGSVARLSDSLVTQVALRNNPRP